MSGYYYLLPQPASAGRKKRVFIFTFYGCTNEEEERQFGIFALKVKSSTCFCQRTLWWEKLMIREKALQLDKVFLVTKRGPCRFPPLCTMNTVDENCEQMSHLKKIIRKIFAKSQQFSWKIVPSWFDELFGRNLFNYQIRKIIVRLRCFYSI